MPDIFANAAHLRMLAAKSRRLADALPNEDGVALRQMAAEYGARANRIDREQSASVT